MEIIVPAAGLSSRFPNLKPKYLLEDSKGELMIYNSLKYYLNNKNNITIGILREHVEQYNAHQIILDRFNQSVNVVVLPAKTQGPADTVWQIIKQTNFEVGRGILIKDCDSFFQHTHLDSNYVCVSKIQDHTVLNNINNKSFVIANSQDIIQSIVEKKVVSDTFCVGGYYFKYAKFFCDAYEKIRSIQSTEIFISHVIQELLLQSTVFQTVGISNYVDVGTILDWTEYNQKITS